MDSPIVVDLAALEDKLMRLKVHSTQSFHRPRIRKMLQEAVSAAYERGVAEGMALYRAGLCPEGLPAPADPSPAPATAARALPESSADSRAESTPRAPRRTPPRRSAEPVMEARPVPYRLRRRKLATA